MSVWLASSSKAPVRSTFLEPARCACRATSDLPYGSIAPSKEVHGYCERHEEDEAPTAVDNG